MIISACLAIAAFPNPAFAGVNLKTGNFNISYTDLTLVGSRKIDITRTYNSVSTELGWFGYGWGSELETRLLVQGDGSIVIKEHGAGAETRFQPAQQSVAEIEDSINAILGAAQAEGSFTTDEEQAAERRKLRSNANHRAAQWTLQVKRGSIAQRVVTTGSVYRTTDRGEQRLTRTHTGFLREQGTRQDEFDEAGRLLRISEGREHYLALGYDAAGLLIRIVDDKGQEIGVQMSAAGRILRLTRPNGQGAVYYEYENDRLIASRDTGGNVYAYRYDDHYNLCTIGYSDGSQMLIGYESATFFTRVVTDRKGETTWFRYGAEAERPEDHYFTEVTKTGLEVEPHTDRYEYWMATLADGRRNLERSLSTINGSTKEIFHDPQTGYITEVRRYPKDKPDEAEWFRYRYNLRNRLAEASHSKGEHVSLEYDAVGRVIAARSADEQMQFTYKDDDTGKPSRVTVQGLGAGNVTYNPEGDFEKVESEPVDGDAALALKITQAMQRLLALVEPSYGFTWV
ncbi:MAG: DUF6531 domain-containing protein [Pseudomonadota bacterium]